MTTENLWAPWRMEYIRQLDPKTPAPGSSAPGTAAPPPCFLCEAAKFPADTDEARQRWVLAHDARGLILLNRYPYTSGHLLVAAAPHVGELSDLTPVQRGGLIELTAEAEGLVRTAFNPQGINIVINLGRCAGAGLPGHLHVHIVPRWNGDTNFMQAVGNVRVIPQALEESYRELREAMARI
jgi:ATP adenylyltransferase